MNKNQDFWRKLPIQFFSKGRGQISPKLHSESLDRLTYAMRRCVQVHFVTNEFYPIIPPP